MLVHECLVGAAETAATPKRAAWVWQGCHTLLICEHLCNLWENILHHKLLWFLWLLWENSLVGSPNLLSMLKSKCFDHYFHFKLRFYILGYKAGGF